MIEVIEGEEAVAYARISDDPRDEQRGTTRQRDDDRAIAKRRGLRLVPDPLTGEAFFVDNDISASKFARKVRKAYKRLVATVAERRVGIIIVYHVDRFLRRNDELEELIKVAEDLGRLYILTSSMEYDVLNTDHQLVLRMLVSVAGGESAATSRRVKRDRQAERDQGLIPAGPAFGWKGREILASEAPIVADVIERFLAGETYAGLARSLNEREVPTKLGGKRWTVTQIKGMVAAPRHYGILAYIERDKRGKPQKVRIIKRDNHQGIVAGELYDQVVATMGNRSRDQRPPRQTMLTGLVFCGRCGTPMTRNRESTKKGVGRGRELLCCRRRDHYPEACNRMSMDAATVDEFVAGAVWSKVDNLDLARMAAVSGRHTAGALAERLARLAKKAAANRGAWQRDAIDDEEYEANAREIKVEREQIERKLAELATSRALHPYAGNPGALEAAWPKLTAEVKREIIAETLALHGFDGFTISEHVGPRNVIRTDRIKPRKVKAARRARVA
jgi:DNA invertase Pin-like site-specific DNA recombinase